MHSIKNTVVAVCLLGVSFLFYQASSKNNTDQTDLIPAFGVSDGSEVDVLAGDIMGGAKDLANQGLDTIKSKMPNLEMPNLDSAKEFATNAASNVASNAASKMNQFGEKIGDQANQFKQKANEFVSSGFPGATKPPAANSLPMNTPTTPPPSMNAGSSLAPIPPSNQFSSGFNARAPNPNGFGGSNSFGESVPATRQPSNEMADRTARDQGLIAELENQFVSSDNSFGSQPAPKTNTDSLAPLNSGNANEFQFNSQPIPSADSSFNQLASNTDVAKSGFDVEQASPGGSASPPMQTLESVWPEVDRLVEAKKFRAALRLLSGQYRSRDLSGPQRQKLVGWLDALAGKVIFSAEHHLTGFPYTVANESLNEIAERWKVAPQLIYNVNRANIPNPAVLNPGTQLKEVKGPFNAEINLEEKVMTLFLGDLYAGRYAIRVGISGTPKPGVFRVLVKSAKGHNWRDAQGKIYPAESPTNGYGPNWIGLSGSLCIHAVDDSATEGHRGCIGLSSKDSKDVFGILTDASTVKIVR
ncbi:MAG: L,D-transpeptidase [Mariniblastus sp.]